MGHVKASGALRLKGRPGREVWEKPRLVLVDLGRCCPKLASFELYVMRGS